MTSRALEWAGARSPVLAAALFVTGIGLWQPGLTCFDQLPGFKAAIGQLRMAAHIHATAAALAIVFCIIHVYTAIWVRGTVSAMTRGTVSGGWAGAITANGCPRKSTRARSRRLPDRRKSAVR